MNDIKRRISRAEMEFEMMVYKTMVAKNHQESMAWAERAHDKELALEALEGHYDYMGRFPDRS